jgi:hypothetical protein
MDNIPNLRFQIEEDGTRYEIIENIYGRKEFRLNINNRYVLHRVKGPAITYSDGSYLWYYGGNLHRLCGPAFFNFQTKETEWYYHGDKIDCASQEEFERRIKLKVFW